MFAWDIFREDPQLLSLEEWDESSLFEVVVGSECVAKP